MPQTFDPDTGALISLTDAQTMVADWVTLQGGPGAITISNPKSHAYGKNKIQDILNQTGCEGIRFYNGVENGNRVILFVGVDANGLDMMNGQIVETGQPCPPFCRIPGIN